MIQHIIKKVVLLGVFLVSFATFANEQEQEVSMDQIMEMMNEHIADSHDYHILTLNGHTVSVPLPVILYTNNGLVTFMSSEFHHDNEGKVLVQKNGQYFVQDKSQIYYANQDGTFDKNNRPLDFSITKNVVVLIIVIAILLSVFISIAKTYANGQTQAPQGAASLFEPLILTVRDDIAKENIGEKKYEKYVPYLLTIFFMILFGNLLGLVPVISGTLTNDILFTGFLAILTFLITAFSGTKHYWGHMFAPAGVPTWLLPIMIPVEVLGMFTKPFALMIRLFANITAGHLVILSLLSVIFVMGKIYLSPIWIGFALMMNFLELLVAFLQAYVFTLLTSLFIGMAAEEGHR